MRWKSSMNNSGRWWFPFGFSSYYTNNLRHQNEVSPALSARIRTLVKNYGLIW